MSSSSTRGLPPIIALILDREFLIEELFMIFIPSSISLIYDLITGNKINYQFFVLPFSSTKITSAGNWGKPFCKANQHRSLIDGGERRCWAHSGKGCIWYLHSPLWNSQRIFSSPYLALWITNEKSNSFDRNKLGYCFLASISTLRIHLLHSLSENSSTPSLFKTLRIFSSRLPAIGYKMPRFWNPFCRRKLI